MIPALDKFRIEIGKLTKFTHKQGKFLKGIRLKFMQIVQICTSLIYITWGHSGETQTGLDNKFGKAERGSPSEGEVSVRIRVFLKGHFVKEKNVHPTT